MAQNEDIMCCWYPEGYIGVGCEHGGMNADKGRGGDIDWVDTQVVQEHEEKRD